MPAARTRAPSPSAEVPGLAARRAAAGAVADVIRSGATLDDALARTHPGADAALARAIATATFRRFGTIWAALSERLSNGVPPSGDAMAVLATGTAQILFLDVPDHAAVDLSVRLMAGEHRLRRFDKLANAVLRGIARERDTILARHAGPLADTPPWLAERWVRRFGAERAAAIAATHRTGSSVDVTPRADPAAWAERLGGTLLPTGSIRLPERVAVRDLPGFAEGAWWVQDVAAALPARLVGAVSGERVLDLCAAPGGKTAQLAATGANVIALDRSAARLARLRANMSRLGLSAEVVQADAEIWSPAGADPFDAVLLDAPCSATGTLRRHPDVAWTKRDRDVAALAALQERLFDRAAALVRPGGRLVYCVCSLEADEGESQGDAFLRRRPDFVREPIRPGEHGIPPDWLSPDGDLRTTPERGPDLPDGIKGGVDGFYAVRLVRAGMPQPETG